MQDSKTEGARAFREVAMTSAYFQMPPSPLERFPFG